MVDWLVRLEIYDSNKYIGTYVSQRLPHAMEMRVIFFRRTVFRTGLMVQSSTDSNLEEKNTEPASTMVRSANLSCCFVTEHHIAVHQLTV